MGTRVSARQGQGRGRWRSSGCHLGVSQRRHFLQHVEVSFPSGRTEGWIDPRQAQHPLLSALQLRGLVVRRRLSLGVGDRIESLGTPSR